MLGAWVVIGFTVAYLTTNQTLLRVVGFPMVGIAALLLLGAGVAKVVQIGVRSARAGDSP